MKIPYLDAHCDTVTRFKSLRECPDTHLDLVRLSKWSPAGQVTALFAPPGKDTEEDFEWILAAAEKEFAANEDIAVLCRSAEEIRAAGAAGKVALILAVEGATLLGCSIDSLLRAYDRGVRIVTLIWNKDNILCGSAQDSRSGLTAAGLEFCRVCWEKGVAVDLSHASEKTFWDVIRIASRPVLCSHSNAKSICDHPRNLTDAQISAVIHNDGCIGLNLCPDFLGRGRNMDAILAHVDHFLCMDARENLCLGTDFDGVEELPEGISGVESMETLYEEMLRHRFSEGLVQDIFYNNLHRFMENAL